MRSCLYHQSSVVKSVAWYSVLHGRYSSPMGRNVCNVNVLLMTFYHVTRSSIIICRYVSASYTDDQYTVYSMLAECLRVRDGLLKLP